jgi:uncharacterized protein YjaG (DUF416 family)
MSTALTVGQILIELLNVSIQAMKAAQLIGKAQAEGRDITNEELKELDANREALVERWKTITKPPAGPES